VCIPVHSLRKSQALDLHISLQQFLPQGLQDNHQLIHLFFRQ
jgi:hypothetical protein